VIQQIGLFPHYTIAENIATVPRLLGWDKARIARRTEELLELVGLDAAQIRDRYPVQLSGGQQQRVGVARALAADPPLMLMDEPFGAIDPINRARLQDEFLRLQALVRKTVVFVTHDIDEAIKMGDRIAILREGGVLAQYAPPAEILTRPADDFVAQFVGTDRALKRLALTSLEDVELIPAEGRSPNGRRVPRRTTVRDALSMILTDGGRPLTVVDGQDEVAGLVTLDLVGGLLGEHGALTDAAGGTAAGGAHPALADAAGGTAAGAAHPALANAAGGAAAGGADPALTDADGDAPAARERPALVEGDGGEPA
jgi:osmoprotectant transport system ATP-binding protein